MSSRGRKRLDLHNVQNDIPEVQGNASLIAPCHDYSSMSTLTVVPEEFPTLPVIPCKSPAAKKVLYGPGDESAEDNIVIHTLSKLINERADSFEKKIYGNTLKIEGLKKTLDFGCNEIKDTQRRVENVDARLKKEEQKLSKLQTQVSDMESYGRRWNLKLYGLQESQNENVKKKVMELCETILPEEKPKAAEAVDIAHRLGKSGQIKPRAIIIRFSLRSYRDALWKAAKNHPFLRDNKLHFAEDLSQTTKEARVKFWPEIKKARSEGKSAFYVGARVFIDGRELT